MTDFGRRAGLGDMLKAVYDPNNDGVLAVAQTEADMTKAVYDPTLAAIATLLADHNAQHQSGGADVIDVTGLVGTTPRALLTGGLAAGVLRLARLVIADGTNVNTLKCTLSSLFYGDTIAETDNIAKGATTGNFTLDSTGYELIIEAAGLAGNVLLACGEVFHNQTMNDNLLGTRASANDIRFRFTDPISGGSINITIAADTGDLEINILYITDA